MSFVQNILNYFKTLASKEYQQKPTVETKTDYFVIDDISVTNMLAERITTLALADSNIKVANTGEYAKMLGSALNRFNSEKLQTVSELTLGTGECLVRVVGNGNEIGFECIPNDNYRVISSVGGLLSAVIIKCDEKRLNNAVFERWELQQIKTDATGMPYLEITQHAFKNGAVYPLQASPWSNFDEPTVIPNCEHLLVARFRNIKTNRYNINSDSGVPITFGAEKLVKAVVKSYNDFNKEMETADRYIFADRTLFRTEERQIGNKIFRRAVLPKDKHIIRTASTGNIGGAPLLQEFNPQIRVEQFEQALERNLRTLETFCGFSEGLISKSTLTYTNTDEVRKSTQQTYAFITKYRQMLEKGITDLVECVKLLVEVNYNVNFGEIVVDCDWSDSYIESMEQRFNELMQAESIGAVSKAELRAWVMDEPIQLAQKRVDEVMQSADAEIDDNINNME